jgi:hypothetical protein
MPTIRSFARELLDLTLNEHIPEELRADFEAFGDLVFYELKKLDRKVADVLDGEPELDSRPEPDTVPVEDRWEYTVYCDDFPGVLNGAAVSSIESAYMVWALLVMDGHHADLVRENDQYFHTLAYVRD